MATNMITAKVTITGTRPILWHHFGPDALPLEKRTDKTGVAGHDPEEWRRTVLMTDERQLYLEPSQVFGCIRDAAKYTKQGRSTLSPSMAATLQVIDERVLVDRFVPEEPIPTDTTKPVYMDIRSVRNPSTRGRNIRYRVAAGSHWSMTFAIVWDRTVIATDQMKAVLRDAGQLVGIGDGRSIGFGRFTVTSFEDMKEEDE